MSYEYQSNYTTQRRSVLWALPLTSSLIVPPGDLYAVESYAFMTEKLIQGGIMDSISASRPEKIIGEIREMPPKSSASRLLKYAGTWSGDDLEERLKEVYSSRGEAEF